MTVTVIDDARADDPVERLLEDSWDERGRRMSRREAVSESLATLLFLACALPLAASALGDRIDPVAVGVLVPLYGVLSRMVKFPIGAGYVVPSYVALVPMLLLLPPALVPLLTALTLAGGAAVKSALTRSEPERIVFSIPDAWHAVGPAVVLMLAGDGTRGWALAAVYVVAFAAGCFMDLLSATLREAGALGIAPQLQVRVLGVVWMIDACLAPLGLLVAHAARHEPGQALLVLPLTVLLLLLVRDRNQRIDNAQRRLDLVAQERTRLQAAVGRLGDAFAAKLDLDALLEILLRGSLEAVGADGGRLTLTGVGPERAFATTGAGRLHTVLEAAAAGAEQGGDEQAEHDGAWGLALPFGFAVDHGRAEGMLTVARHGRGFREDERDLIAGLVERARQAAEDIVANQALRELAVTDPLTGLGNRRRLAADLTEALQRASTDEPLVLMLFDLDGFKAYNDTFGHPAGDALLARLGGKLAASVSEHGRAYRLGGDEFCALLTVRSDRLHAAVAAAADGLQERGEGFSIGASYGAVLLPHEATTADYAIQLADERMYSRKRASRGRRSADPTRDVLMSILHARGAELHHHCSEVADLTLRVGRRLRMSAEQLDELARAAELHDVGKVAIPDAILDKPAPLTCEEWEYMRQHTVLGERILSASPAMRPVAVLVRASHERWDGRGYPDGLAGEAIPLGARIISVCDAFEAMTSTRCYRAAMPVEAAREELRREAGRQFDPDVVEAFLAELDRRPAAPRRHRSPEPASRSAAVDEIAAQLQATLARHADLPAGSTTPV